LGEKEDGTDDRQLGGYQQDFMLMLYYAAVANLGVAFSVYIYSVGINSVGVCCVIVDSEST